jgi:hypothetical protein
MASVYGVDGRLRHLRLNTALTMPRALAAHPIAPY